MQQISLLPGEAFEELYGDKKIIQNKNLYRFTSDSILLSRFARAKYGDVVADFCSGSGIVGLHFLCLNGHISGVTLFEMQPSLSDMAARTIAFNGFENALAVCCRLQDICREYDDKFSLVLCNPPYERGGLQNLTYEKAVCRKEITITLPEIVSAAYKKLKYGGRFALVNRDILSPLLKPVLCAVSPFTNCLMRTTLAPTQAEGASTPNTLPPVARGTINARINTGETVEEVRDYIQRVVGKHVKISVLEGSIDPSPVSDTGSEAYADLARTIREVFDGYIVAPYPFIAASDAKHYYNLTNNVYRFTPFEKTVEDANRIHGVNERQDVKMLVQGTRFFIRLYENTCM